MSKRRDGERVLTCHTRGGFTKAPDLGGGLFSRSLLLPHLYGALLGGSQEAIVRGLGMSAPLSTAAPAQLDNPQHPPFDISESSSGVRNTEA